MAALGAAVSLIAYQNYRWKTNVTGAISDINEMELLEDTLTYRDHEWVNPLFMKKNVAAYVYEGSNNIYMRSSRFHSESEGLQSAVIDILHEKAHLFFYRHLNDTEKERFSQHVRRGFAELQDSIDAGAETYGEAQYYLPAFFRIPVYEEEYGEDFDRKFHGSETFAILAEPTLLFSKSENPVNIIPHELRDFYRGFLHPRFLISRAQEDSLFAN